MRLEIPKIDGRRSRQVYEQARRLARIYCPEWEGLPGRAYKEDDPGVVLLKLFSRLVETVIGQVNRIPEKHLLAFYDFIGIDHMPPAAARTPLTFTLSEGSTDSLVPTRTKVASSSDPSVVFETTEALSVVNFRVKSAYSLNPWHDAYTAHGDLSADHPDGFRLFGNDPDERPLDHALYMAADGFAFTNPAVIAVTLTLKAWSDTFKDYFSVCADGAGNPFPPDFVDVIASPAKKQLTIRAAAPVLIPKSAVDGMEAHWISLRPKNRLPLGKKALLPEITKMTVDVNVDGILPDVLLADNSPADAKKGFCPFGQMPKIGDALYVGSDDAFSKVGATVTLVVNLRGGKGSKDVDGRDLSLAFECWDGSRWSEMTGVEDTTKAFTQSGTKTISIASLPLIPLTDINGVTSRWIRVKVKSGGYGDPGRYEPTKTIGEIINSAALPKAEITGVVSSARADVLARLKGENIAVPESKVDAIFSAFKSNPGILSENVETVILKYREDILNRLIKEGITAGLVYTPPSYAPPFIDSVTIRCAYIGAAIRECKLYNNFEYTGVDSGKGFSPYIMTTQVMPAFYFGFEGPLLNNPVSLYFAIKSGRYGDIPEVITDPDYAGKPTYGDKVKGYAYRYYNGQEWTELVCSDETDHLTKSGIVQFIIPMDALRHRLFGEDLHWVRIELKNGAWFEPPTLRGIFPNAVWSENASVIENEFLGSSNGQPGQIFGCAAKPLLDKQTIEVKEPGIPSEDEMEFIEAGGDAEALRIKRNDSGDIEEIWVRWTEVKTFVHSHSLSRHYVVDRVNGKVLFGDGVHGMIPPPVPNNILARRYKCGGGARGNVKADTLTELKTTIPNVQAVTNPDSASGGRDLESAADVLLRSPRSVKSGDRAVTAQDFRGLALEASPQVSKARCILSDSGAVELIIAPAYEDDSLTPESSLIDYVETYVRERAFAVIREGITVSGPTYRSVDVKTTLVTISFSETTLAADRVERRLKEFFHPIKGGPEGKGWDFGRDVLLSEVAAAIEAVEGIDFIKDLSISFSRTEGETTPEKEDTVMFGGQIRLRIDVHELPRIGQITIQLS